MKLTDEQRAGLARFLGFKEVAIVSKRFAPCHPYLIDADGTLEGERQWNDADLMLALLERATEIGYEPESDYDSHQRQWFERIRMWMQDHPMLFGEGKSADKAEAVILAVLQLPEAAEPQNTVRSNA
jgi:hypothetical protein